MAHETTTPVQEAHRLLRTVQSECKDGYALAYVDAGLSITDPHELGVQIAYVLSNTSHWRGETARQAKKELKALMVSLRGY